MTTDPRSAAEWRADPLGIAAYRWWDGSGWTGYTADAITAPPATESAASSGLHRDVHVAAAPAAVLTAPAPAAEPTRGPWPASLPDPPQRRATTLEEAAAGYGVMPEGVSDDIDWSRLVLRLKTAIDTAETELLEVRAGSLPVLLIDVSQHAYWWQLGLADVPGRVTSLAISGVDRIAHGVLEPGRDLDPLLWTLAHAAFDGGEAPWMRLGDRYRLHRWPNLTTLPHQPHHLRAISLLGQAALTADEFARVADLDPTEARRLLTTFSLMGLLRVSANEARAAMFVSKPKPTGGLFSRLSKFFGGR